MAQRRQGLLKRSYIFSGSPDVRQRVGSWLAPATFLDIETTGLDPTRENVGIWQGAIGHRTPGGGVSMAYNQLINPGTDPSKTSFWTRQQLQQSPWKGAQPIGQTPWKSPVTPSSFIDEFTSHVRGRDLWVQNLKFESRHIAHTMTDEQYRRFVSEARPQTFAYDEKGGAFRTKEIYTTSRPVDEAISRAYALREHSDIGRRLGAWGDVYSALRTELSTKAPEGVTRIFDIQDVSRSMLALGQMHGIMPTSGDVFTGTSVDVFSRLALGIPEKHLAAQDIKVQNLMLEYNLGIAEKLYQGGASALGEGEKSYLRAIHYLKEDIQQQNIAKTIMSAHEDIHKRGLSYSIAHAPYKTANISYWEQDPAGAPVDEAGGHRVRAVTKRIEVPERTDTRDMREVLKHIKETRGAGFDVDAMYASFEHDVVDAAKRGGNYDALAYKWSQKYRISDARLTGAMLGEGRTKAPVPGMKDKLNSFWKNNWKLLTGVGVGAAVLGGLAYNMRSDVEWNPPDVPDLPDEEPGVAKSLFTSARGAINKTVDLFMGPPRGEGLNRRRGGSTARLTADPGRFNVEDADTAELMLAGGQVHQLRLVGIDAPEVGHAESYARGRIRQDQPYGQEATQELQKLIAAQHKVSVLYDPTEPTTYGRTPAVLIGTDVQGRETNINLELVKSGAASYLPFGSKTKSLIDRSAFLKAEQQAVQERRGMYGSPEWVTENTLSERQKRITHTTLTDPERMMENFKAASMFRRMYHTDKNQSERTASGGKDDHNIIEGLRHGWFGSSRSLRTDFGSGYQGIVNLYRGTSELILEHMLKRELPPRSHMVSTTAYRYAEIMAESVRKSRFADRPQRLSSTFWTPSAKSAAEYVGDQGGYLSLASMDSRSIFMTNQSSWGEIQSRMFDAVEKGMPDASRPEIIKAIERYWGGVTPGSRAADIEALIPGVTRTQGIIRIPGGDDAYNLIEGLNERGLAAQMRKNMTDFGSGYQGLKAGLGAAGDYFKKFMKSEAGHLTAVSLGLGIATGMVTNSFGTGYNTFTGGLGGASLGFLKGGFRGALGGLAVGAVIGGGSNEVLQAAGAGTVGSAFLAGITSSVASSLMMAGSLRGGLFYKTQLAPLETLFNKKAGGEIPDSIWKEFEMMLGHDPRGPQGFATNATDMATSMVRAYGKEDTWYGRAINWVDRSPRVKGVIDASLGSPRLIEAANKAGGGDKMAWGDIGKAVGWDVVEGIPVGLGFAAIGGATAAVQQPRRKRERRGHSRKQVRANTMVRRNFTRDAKINHRSMDPQRHHVRQV